ncbi:unnamed protein product [Urochloa decumbens]|uniref:SIAH-type domain-containing protein n=1 Tax=Urochloa decumbens TaxID=240449 RepID=A0ABC8YVU7_9POAL
MHDQRNKRSVAVVVQNGDHGHSGKKRRAAQAVVKQEVEEGEVVSQGSEGERTVEAMDEPQIDLRMAISLLQCQACHRPLKPPTFTCKAEHRVCSTCRDSHSQVCDGGAAYAACVQMDAIVQDAKVACAYREFGCESFVVYHGEADHRRACPWAPCSCPDPGCGFSSSPARLAEHFAATHSWPVTGVSYATPCRLPVPPPQGLHVLVAGNGEGRPACVFLVSASALGAATAVSLVCVRANGGGDAAAQQFECALWVETPRKRGYAMAMCAVGSSDMFRGFVAADQGMFLAVPPELLRDDSSGEAPVLKVRIDKAGAAAESGSTQSARSSRRLQ